jgi:hypothetical protein
LNNDEVPHFEARLAQQLPLGYNPFLHGIEYVMKEYPLLICLNILQERYLFHDREHPLLHRIVVISGLYMLLELCLKLRDLSNQGLIILD